jgi:threonine dehydratase
MIADSSVVTSFDVARAEVAVARVVNQTPVLSFPEVDLQVGAKVYFKCENFQLTGSFKFRGAYNAISRLTDAQKRCGVVAYSSGNHALGVALAGRLLGVNVTVVIPADAPEMKMKAAESYGAKIVHYDRELDHREMIANALARKSGATLIASSEHPDVIAGQATATKELIDEVGPLDYLFVPVGGGGLLAGSAIAAAKWSSGCTVIGVEPDTGNDAQQSMRAGFVVHIPSPVTIADGARNQHIGEIVLPILQTFVKQIVTVTESQLRDQMRIFVERMKLVVEPTGCLAAAAVMNGVIDVSKSRVGVLLTGGNICRKMLSEALSNHRNAA